MSYLAERGCRYSIGVTMHKVAVERIAKECGLPMSRFLPSP